MDPNEGKWDKQLKIRTGGRDASHADQYRYPYEPTPYSVLERLADSGYISRSNTVLDYGCGKGRVSFFLSWRTGCSALGVEFDRRIYDLAVENRKKAVSAARVTLINGNAEEYRVPRNVDRCWFFNPFSVEVLRRVLGRLKQSTASNPREILLFFYYPEDEYLTELNADPDLSFAEELDCRDLFQGDNRRERILIYRLDPYL